MFAIKRILSKTFKQHATFKPTFKSTKKPIFKPLTNNKTEFLTTKLPNKKIFVRNVQTKSYDSTINTKITSNNTQQMDMMFLYIIGGMITLVIFVVKNVYNSIRMYNIECRTYNPTKLFEHIWRGIGNGLMYGIPYSIVYPMFWSFAIFEHYKNKILCTYSTNIKVHNINLYFIPDAFYVIRQLIDLDAYKDLKQREYEKNIITHYYNTHIKLLEYYEVVRPTLSLNNQLKSHHTSK